MENDGKKTQCTQKRVCSLRLCMLTILQFSSPCRPRKRDTPSDNILNTLGQKFMFKRQKQVKVRVSVCVQEEIWSKNAEIFDNVNLNPDIFADGTFIPIVNKFVYLGSYLTRDCRDDMDVKERIYAAGGAFRNLRDCLFSFPKKCPDANRLHWTYSLDTTIWLWMMKFNRKTRMLLSLWVSSRPRGSPWI